MDVFILSIRLSTPTVPGFKDTHNFLVTAEHIEGPWSDPVFLNCSGFDPSLFHDGDRKWLVNMTIDHRMDRARFPEWISRNMMRWGTV